MGNENEEEPEDEYLINFVTSSAISRVNLKFLIVYLPIIWLSGMITLTYWWIYQPRWHLFIDFLLLLPAHILAMLTIFTFACVIFSKLLLILVNLIHKPREGIFRAELGDNDFEFWCLRIEIKKLVLWLFNNWPLPWADVIAFKWFGTNIDLSSHLHDAWCDAEFVKFGKRVMVGQGAVVMSSMVIGKYLIIKEVVLDDHTVVGGQSTVAPGTILGEESVVGAAGSTAFNQILEPGWIYAGIPARKLKTNEHAIKRRDIIVKKKIDEEEKEEIKQEVNIDEDKKDLV
ncbi:MAG: Bacterial transferase hexapeptide (Six repeats) [Promethearchaeota archaeon]|nr:MAG: Bacterial transferase hexapeptide (Six repeats) [Candidatus Lokiarchaeota archaeon]